MTMEEIIDVVAETVEDQPAVEEQNPLTPREIAINRRESEQRLKELKKELKKFRRYAKSTIHVVRQMDIDSSVKTQ